MKMNKGTGRQLVNILAVIVTIGINGLANALPLNGQTTGEISDRFQVYFVPAGYVFSIWGLIYIGLVAFAVYQALPVQRENPRLRSIGYMFALSCLANIVWLFLWHYEIFPLTLVAMGALLLLLITIYLRLDINRMVIMLTTGVAIASAVSLTRGDVAYMLVIMWAFSGIAVKHAATPMVATAAWVTTALVALMLVVGISVKRRRERPPTAVG